MFASILIANRGEIAVRIARTAQRLGVRTIAVYSEADANAYHVRVADEAVAIGPADARRSYLDVGRIIDAARRTGAEAIHPGYGFLSENAGLAKACEVAGIAWVGPPAGAIRAMGSKSEAKALMERAGVPVVPGYHGEMQDAAFLKRKAYEVGYPVLIKAVAGGGGKGMRRVDKALAFDEALDAARREAASAFGDDRVLVERYVTDPRHVEIQVFADAQGRTVSLFERDCSVQRRHQKVVEEAPAPGMGEAMRHAMGEAAVRAAQAVGYVGAGTVEFIAEGAGGLSQDAYYFMEMNTRLQVEHPVTEMVTGIDLVEWQLRIASGERLPEGRPRPPRGHALEVRLYAEDPDHDFLPSSGRIAALAWPQGIRVDAGVEAGDVVSAHYDPMIAKLIVHAADRTAAIAAMADALENTVVIGPKTNLAFLRAVIGDPTFRTGAHDTGFVDANLDNLTGGEVGDRAIANAAVALLAKAVLPRRRPSWPDPFAISDAFRMTGSPCRSVALDVGGKVRIASVVGEGDDARVTVEGVEGIVDGEGIFVVGSEAYAFEAGRAVRVALLEELSRTPEEAEGGAGAKSPMHGRLIALYVAAGDEVRSGDKLFAVEAMKMEHTVRAGSTGRVDEVRAALGDQVAEGAEIIALTALDGATGDRDGG